ncbi:Monocarboxylate transporter 14 like protein [Argiope bruennichi]|uniref:Monocarboxylate transporter 14 like protein n=1 Tax=Argiope bruennichi TaxID=94029 RepID=A0A8T0F1H4_ARGBR|nr:Monocarboxylate transporter 14 like protein [Argiope bruennichi]
MNSNSRVTIVHPKKDKGWGWTTASKASLVMSVFLGVSYCIGIGVGFIYLPSIVSIPLYFEKYRATAMGLSTAGSGIGSLVFAPLTQWLIAFYCTWKGAMLIGTGLVLNCLFLSLFYRDDGAFVKANEAEEGIPSDDDQDSSDFYQIQDPTSTNNPDLIQASENLDVDINNVVEGSRINSVTSFIPLTPSTSTAKVPCSGFRKTVRDLMDLTLFKNYVFCVFSVFSFLYYFGISSPTVYVFHLATDLKIATKLEASFLISIMGIANTIAKIIFGLWADRASLSVLNIYIICLFVNGISTTMISLINEYYQIALYSFVFETTWGATIALTSILLVDLLGLDKLSNAYGLYLLVTGISTSAGAPVTGILYNITGSYNLGFYLAGGFTIIGTLLLLIIPSVQRRFPQ